MDALKLSKISKSFGPTLALDGVDLELREGEVHALIGENGAGKSTLMNIIAGNMLPESGLIYVNGTLVEIKNPQAGFDLGIAVVDGTNDTGQEFHVLSSGL